MTQLHLLDQMTHLAEAEKDWLLWARSFAKTYCALHGSVTSDAIRMEADRTGLQPNSSHSFGAIFLEKGWHCVGRVRSTVRSNNGRHISVWEWREC